MKAWELGRGVPGALASLLIATLSGLGVGSGGLFVIWLTEMEGVCATDARGLNLLFFVFSAGAALILHLQRRRLRAGLVIFMAVFACLGTLAGTYISAHLSPALLKKLLGVMLTASGLYTLIGLLIPSSKKKSHVDKELSH